MSDKKPTIREVAQRAGVSIGTASRVLNGSTNVGVEIRRRVESAIGDLNFEPSVAAQSMKGGATHSIGLVLRDIINSDFAELVRSAQQTLLDNGYTLLLACHAGDRQREVDIIRAFRQRRIDGVIIGTYSDQDTEIAALWSALGVPIVLYDQEYPATSDSIQISHEAVTAEATRHLLGLGHRRIAFVCGPTVTYPGRARRAGYVSALSTAGIPFDPTLVSAATFDGKLTFGEVTRLLTMHPRPTAVLLGGIEMLAGAVRAIRAKGLSIPQDISLVGVGQGDLASLMTPPVTNIRWNSYELGAQLARLLLDRLRGEKFEHPRRHICEAELIVRGSTAAVDETVH